MALSVSIDRKYLMTATRVQNPSLLNRIAGGWRSFFVSGDLTTLIILTVMLLAPPLSLQAGEWPLDMGIILPVTVASVLFGLLLARSQFNELLALIISTTYGFCFVLISTAMSLEMSLGTSVYEVFIRAATWMHDAATGGINPDDLVFTLLVALLFWFLGYNAAWHIFRIDRIWRVVLPPGVIIATNMVYSENGNNLQPYLVIYLFMALLLIVRSNLDAREWDWYVQGIRVPRHLRRQFLRAGALLALMTLLVGWSIPSGNLQERLDRFQEFLDSSPMRQISEFWNRLVSPIESQGPTTADYYGGDSLDLGGAIRLGEQIVFLVDALPEHRYYWRSRVFDTYEFGRWTPAADTRLIDSRSPFDVRSELVQARTTVEQQFTIALNASRIVYTAPQPLQVNLPTRTDLFYISDNLNENDRAMSVSVIRPTELLRRGDSYTAASQMTLATATQLRGAGTVYPEWVTSLYLYVSASVTQRTRDLALDIVAEATNPYDQAKAIERYLRTNIIYNERIPRPPENQDPVDWVLFDHQEGYCNYYASAMIIMLRTLGIPARMAAGFAQGNYDPAQQTYVVTERDAHTWVEAYFPSYGWIEFEPTSAQAPLDREGDNEVNEQMIPPPGATPTPTTTATPPPTSTPEATPTPLPLDQNNADVPTLALTITLTFTPSPTATPVIIPTQPPPINPQPQNPFELILPAVGLLLLGILFILLLVIIGILIWWWWEWRGMRGLSPISRAYARLERYMSLIGIYFRRDETPEERRYMILRNVPKAERPVTAITRLYIDERYGPEQEHPAQGRRRIEIAEQAWPDARGNILKRWLRKFMFWRRN